MIYLYYDLANIDDVLSQPNARFKMNTTKQNREQTASVL